MPHLTHASEAGVQRAERLGFKRRESTAEWDPRFANPTSQQSQPHHRAMFPYFRDPNRSVQGKICFVISSLIPVQGSLSSR